MEYASEAELFAIIRKINADLLSPAVENIIHLEELDNRNYFIYAIALRDAYSHLSKILQRENPLDSDAKKEIGKDLILYYDHLERTLIDTYRKICDVKLNAIYSAIPKKQEVDSVKAQIAAKIKSLRLLSPETPEGRRQVYVAMIEELESIYNKFKGLHR